MSAPPSIPRRRGPARRPPVGGDDAAAAEAGAVPGPEEDPPPARAAEPQEHLRLRTHRRLQRRTGDSLGEVPGSKLAIQFEAQDLCKSLSVSSPNIALETE